MPCGYNNIEQELKNILIKNKLKNKYIFGLNGCDTMVSKNKIWESLVKCYGRKHSSTLMPESYVLDDLNEMEIFRKKITINILFIVIFSSFFLVFFNISLDVKSNFYRSDYSDKKIDNKYNLRPVDGDIIFRVGKSFWTPFFVKANQRNGFSHLGVVIYDNEIL